MNRTYRCAWLAVVLVCISVLPDGAQAQTIGGSLGDPSGSIGGETPPTGGGVVGGGSSSDSGGSIGGDVSSGTVTGGGGAGQPSGTTGDDAPEGNGVVGGGTLGDPGGAIGETDVDTLFPAIIEHAVSPLIFSPNNDGVLDITNVFVRFTEVVTLQLDITDTDGVVVRTYRTDNVPSYAVSWDGLRYDGSIATTGTYALRWTLRDAAGNATVRTEGSCAVDTVAPETHATVSYAVTNSPYTHEATLSLAATDVGAAGVSRILYRENGGPWQVYTASLRVTREGTTTVEYAAEDTVGNLEQMHTVFVRVHTLYGLLEQVRDSLRAKATIQASAARTMLALAMNPRFWADRNTLRPLGSASVRVHLMNTIRLLGRVPGYYTEVETVRYVREHL